MTFRYATHAHPRRACESASRRTADDAILRWQCECAPRVRRDATRRHLTNTEAVAVGHDGYGAADAARRSGRVEPLPRPYEPRNAGDLRFSMNALTPSAKS